MPLCERIRIDAGRAYTQTIFARTIVALALILLIALIAIFRDPGNSASNEQKSAHEKVTNISVTNTVNKLSVEAKNDIYGR